jgi:hypothetical protein
LAVQLQPNVTLAELIKGHHQARLDPIDENAIRSGSRSARRRAYLTCLHMRVGGRGKAGIWASIPIRLHRLWPQDAKVTWIYLFRYRVATTYYWEVMFSIARDAGFAKEGVQDRGTVGVDVGWRPIDGTLRVAVLSGKDRDPAKPLVVPPLLSELVTVSEEEEGDRIELRMPKWFMEFRDKCDDLQSIRTRMFNVAKARLKRWISQQKKLPAEFLERVQYIDRWKSSDRLAGLSLRWRSKLENPPAGEPPWPPMPTWLDLTLAANWPKGKIRVDWRASDKHLYEWQEQQRLNLIRYRNMAYRRLAVWLRQYYGTVQLEKLRVKKLLTKNQPEEPEEQTKLNRFQSHLAAVSKLTDAIKQSGVQVVHVDPKNTTKRCHFCGHINEFDQRAELITTCSNCGRTADQDYRAAVNIRDGEPYNG